MSTLLFNVLFIIFLPIISICICVKEDDNIVLSSIELINLVRKEHLKNNRSLTTYLYLEREGQTKNPDWERTEPEELYEDDNTLKDRKIWSRWSKWGVCSVTCGGGVYVRHRVCVAGRCAPGEREEQHRPCCRTPCLMPQYNVTEDPHELE